MVKVALDGAMHWVSLLRRHPEGAASRFKILSPMAIHHRASKEIRTTLRLLCLFSEWKFKSADARRTIVKNMVFSVRRHFLGRVIREKNKTNSKSATSTSVLPIMVVWWSRPCQKSEGLNSCLDRMHTNLARETSRSKVLKKLLPNNDSDNKICTNKYSPSDKQVRRSKLSRFSPVVKCRIRFSCFILNSFKVKSIASGPRVWVVRIAGACIYIHLVFDTRSYDSLHIA